MPKGGGASISQEDLKRDVWLLTKDADVAKAFAKRLEQMHVDALERDETRVCGRHDGDGPARVLVAPWVVDVPTAIDAAVLISLAKGWDIAVIPPRTTWLCMAKEGAPLPEGERMPVPTFSEAKDVAAVDYEALARDVATLLGKLDSVEALGELPRGRQ